MDWLLGPGLAFAEDNATLFALPEMDVGGLWSYGSMIVGVAGVVLVVGLLIRLYKKAS